MKPHLNNCTFISTPCNNCKWNHHVTTVSPANNSNNIYGRHMANTMERSMLINIRYTITVAYYLFIVATIPAYCAVTIINGSLRLTHDPLSSWPMTHGSPGSSPRTSASLTQIYRLPGTVFGHCILYTHTIKLLHMSPGRWHYEEGGFEFEFTFTLFTENHSSRQFTHSRSLPLSVRYPDWPVAEVASSHEAVSQPGANQRAATGCSGYR